MDLLLFRNLVAHASQAALLTAGAALLSGAIRRAHPQVTLGVWQAVLAATAVLPLVQPWTPVTSQLVSETSVTLTAGELTSGAPTFVVPGAVFSLIGWALLAGVVLRLAWIAVGIHQLRGRVASARRIETLPDSIASAMLDTRASANFYESDLEGPVSFGFRSGVVLLPRRFATLDARSQYLVAFHELLHVRRRDALQCLVEELLVAIFWFYPWVWWVRNRIRLAREQVVDRATARTRPVREVYIRTLLGFARGAVHERTLPTASGMWRPRELRARIDALYKEVIMSRPRLLASATAIVVALGALAALGATAFPLYSAADRRAPAARPAVIATPIAAPSPSRNADRDEDAIRVGGHVRPPTKVKDVRPVYPPEAKEAGIQGVVIIETRINKEGKVANAEVVRSIPELDQAALDAVLQWEFEPTLLNGKPVAVLMTVTINFTLE